MSDFSAHLRRNAVSYLALFTALGGTSYAAVALPKNSVGTPQLKKNAVTTAKVKDGSLIAKDFKPGELPGGKTGPQGPAGPQGAAGANGKDGANGTNGTNGTNGVDGKDGARGPSDGFSSTNNASASVSNASVEDTLSLPAGKFIAVATADVENGGAAGAGTVTCSLTAGGMAIDTIVLKLAADGQQGEHQTIALSGSATFPNGDAFGVDCSQASTAASLTGLDIEAVQVAALTAN